MTQGSWANWQKEGTVRIIPSLQPLHCPEERGWGGPECPREREGTRATEDGPESSPTARQSPPSGGPIGRRPPAVFPLSAPTALCSQEPRLTQPRSEPQAWLEGGEGGQAHLAASGRMGGGAPTLWPGGPSGPRRLLSPPHCGRGREMLSAPAPGEYSTGQLHSLAGSGTFFIKQCLPSNTYDGQAV